MAITVRTITGIATGIVVGTGSVGRRGNGIVIGGEWLIIEGESADENVFICSGDRDKSSKRGGYSPQPPDPTDFDDNYDSDNNQEFFYQQKPNNKIIVRGLAAHITEADVSLLLRSRLFDVLMLCSTDQQRSHPVRPAGSPRTADSAQENR